MENASKALIMAGSVLIALLIIGALILMFNNLSNYQDVGTQDTREAQVLQFNSQYDTYNRNNVRGSDLYSLLNRIVDYNRRKSTEGTGTSDEGQYLAYQPMEITFTIDRTKLTADGTNRLFTVNDYTVNKNTNKFEEGVKTSIEGLERTYGSGILSNLCTGLTKIFIDGTNPTRDEKVKAILNFNSAYGKEYFDIKTNGKYDDTKINNAWTRIKPSGTIRNDVYKYYEYVQFKRASFDCKSVEYNEKTGRIIKMNFEFNGKFN